MAVVTHVVDMAAVYPALAELHEKGYGPGVRDLTPLPQVSLPHCRRCRCRCRCCPPWLPLLLLQPTLPGCGLGLCRLCGTGDDAQCRQSRGSPAARQVASAAATEAATLAQEAAAAPVQWA